MKKELRKYIREQKRRFSQQDLSEMALPVISAVLANEKVRGAHTVLCYHALPDEVPTAGILRELLAMGKVVLLPRVVSDMEMTVHRFQSDADLVVGAYGILEPCGEEWHDAIDIAIVPGMAFDRVGHRLGRGKGYYDLFLSQHPNTYKIGICYPFQLLDNVPADNHDIVMNEVTPYPPNGGTMDSVW